MSEAEDTEGRDGQGSREGEDRKLGLQRARGLEEQSFNVLPEIFQALTGYNRPVLMECGNRSRGTLANKVRELSEKEEAAVHCGCWNSCDLGKTEGLRLQLDRIRLERPQHVWMSPMCDSYSALQNLNNKSPEQKAQILEQRQQELRGLVGMSCVVNLCIQLGIHVTVEMPERSQAWRLPVCQQLFTKQGLLSSVTKGCCVNFRDPRNQQLIQKGWRLATTHTRLAQSMNLPCRCGRQYKHGSCLGLRTSEQDQYTPEYANRVSRLLCQELSHQRTIQECAGMTQLLEGFGEGEFCTCGEAKGTRLVVDCACCLKGKDDVPREGSLISEFLEPSEGLSELEGLECFGSPLANSAEAEVVDASFKSDLEAQARRLLETKHYQHQAMEQILEQLPYKPSPKHRGPIKEKQARYLAFGLYSYGNQYGVTKQTQMFPEVTRYILSYLKHWSPEELHCTSFVVNDNCHLEPHRDVHNLPGTPNYILGIGSYQGGELWVESSDVELEKVVQRGVRRKCGDHMMKGREVCVRQQVVQFDGRKWHATQEWKGNRVTLSAYSSRGWSKVGREVQEHLQSLGFPGPPGNLNNQAYVLKDRGPWSGPLKKQSDKEEEAIKRKLYLLHAATGHGSIRTMVEALKRRNADPKVLELARQFRCSVCEEKRRVQPRQVASLEPLPPKFHTITADVGHWTHPTTGEQQNFMVIVDEGSRYRVARILTKGKAQAPSAALCLNFLTEGWIQHFGCPKTMRLDPAGSFRAGSVEGFCDRHGVYLDIIPGEAHWQIGVAEQAIQGIKQLMSKTVQVERETSAEELLSIAVATFNQRDLVRGFSPTQHVLGVNPDTTGSYVQLPEGREQEPVLNNPAEEFKREAKLRAEAEKSLAEWNAQQRIQRALNSRTRPDNTYYPGDLVYFWRTQESNKSKKQPGTNQGRFLGPARVLAMETRKDDAGQRRPAHAIWCVRGRSLIKCSPEQLRLASQREELIEALSEKEATPWTFTRLAEEVGGNQYQDVSNEIPTVEEWARAQDPTQEAPPRRYRIVAKRPQTEMSPGDQEMPEDLESGTSQPSSLRRVEPQEPQHGLHTQASHWRDEVRQSAWVAEQTCFWTDSGAAVEVEVAVPESRRGLDSMTRDMQSYFVGALKRKAVEVSERRLSPADRERFQEAKGVEVKNFIAAQAFEALPEHLKPNREQAVGMRWILTWKVKEDGSVKPKARAVLLGYQDPGYEHRATTAPVMTRQTRQLMLQLAANKRWRLMKGDVSGAFLQGRTYPTELYCVPCDEICQAMGINPGSITRLKKACYGLVDAPLEWYKTVANFFSSLGLEKLWSDSCAWMWRKDGVVRGMIAGHVDDFLFGGSDDDAEWQGILLQIREHFKWGDWDKDSFVQCGVQIEATDSGFALSQPKYAEGIEAINISSSRRTMRKAPTTDHEKSKLRGLLGGLSWHAQQVAPHVSAEVGLMLSEVNQSTVETLIKANLLLEHTKARKDHKMLISRQEGEMHFFAWVDAASQNRIDGGSTQGILIGASGQGLQQGDVAAISPISWHSTRIDRVCRSPGAAETAAAVNGEDMLYYVRYQWSEMIYGKVDLRHPNKTVSKVPGYVITDSRNVYDKLATAMFSVNGAEKKANIELMGLKEAQEATGVIMRWVHSEAQLANALTKAQQHRELELYYRMQHQWRIVEDTEMKSARKRKNEGLEPLQ